MNRPSLIRPDWTPATIALMILGFMVFWPLGLVMLAYIVYGERLQQDFHFYGKGLRDFKKQANEQADRWFSNCRSHHSASSHKQYRHARSGNSAFDDWREKELERLYEERRKLDEMREEFDEYMRELHKARDREEFDRFMNARNQSQKGSEGNHTSQA